MYCLHRQTAYLAQDFFDRFMVTQENVDKDCLQLIGITALFIASKIEVRLSFVFDPPLTPNCVLSSFEKHSKRLMSVAHVKGLSV